MYKPSGQLDVRLVQGALYVRSVYSRDAARRLERRKRGRWPPLSIKPIRAD